MSTPTVAEARVASNDATDSYMNLSSNALSVQIADSSARTSAMSSGMGRRGRSGATRFAQGLDTRTGNEADGDQNAVSSTSGANDNQQEYGNVISEAVSEVSVEGVNLQRPITPLMRIKLSELSTSSSDSEGDDGYRGTVADGTAGPGDSRRPSSPPPNCAICLGRCKNKCFTDSCMHQFCFKCLCEWSKVKPECPLCKQTFKSIIHNVKSIDQFEEYHVQPPTVQIPHRPIEVAYRNLPYIFDGVVVEGPDWELPRRRNSAHRIRPSSSGIFYPSAMSDAVDNGDNANSSNGPSVYNHLVYRNELLDMYRQEAPDAIASSGTLSQLWRRFIYDRRLYALPVCDITGRFRESTARFYRDNPAQVHRLMPWINRDVVCLLRNTEHDVSALLERINETILQANILSPAFRRRLQPYLGAKTSHFIHELNNFARSPYDMIGYDRAVHYLPQAPEEIVIEFSSSASSDDENVSNDHERRPRSRNSRARSAGEYRVLSRSGNPSVTSAVNAQQPMLNLLSFTISTTSEGVEAPGVTVAVSGRSGQSAAINLSTHNRVSGDIIDLDESEVVYEAGTSRAGGEAGATTAGIATTSSGLSVDSGAINATTNQHPLPTVTENIELTSSSSDDCEFVLERKPPHLRTPELVSLNSESDSDVVFVEESKPLRKSTFSSSGEEEQNAVEKSNKKSSTQNTTVALAQATHITGDQDEEELYNVGASTSTGLRSSGAGRGIKEIYERSRRSTTSRRKRNLRSSNTKDEAQTKVLGAVRRGKRIYESSCTSSNSDSASSDTDDEEFSVKRKRSKAQRNSRKKKPNRSRRRGGRQPNRSSSNSHGRNSAISRKRQLITNTNRQQNENVKKCKIEAMTSDSEYTSDDSQNLIELQRRLQALKERDKHEGTFQKIDKTLAYLIECEMSGNSPISNINTNNHREHISYGADELGTAQRSDLQQLDTVAKQETFDSDQQDENSLQSECDLHRLAQTAEDSSDVAQNVRITSTNECEEEAMSCMPISRVSGPVDEENTFSSSVTQTTSTTVTTTAANVRSLSRASATTNNTNDNDNAIENYNEDDNENSSSTTSTSTSASDTSVSSPSLYTASSAGEEEEGEENNLDGNSNGVHGTQNMSSSLGLQQLLDTASLSDAWLAHQLGNSVAGNEVEVSMATHEADGANGIDGNQQLLPQHIEEEAVALPDIEAEDDVSSIFLNHHDSSLVMPFNYDAEGSQSDAE